MKKFILIILLLVALFVFFVWGDATQVAPMQNYDNISGIRVIDGDTFELESGQRVRLIGIDCPEFGLRSEEEDREIG